MLPIRCYTCGKILGNLQTAWHQYRESIQEQEHEDWYPFFEKFLIRRYCCRRVIMTHQPDMNHQNVYILPSSVQSSESGEIHDIFIAR